MIRGVTHNVPFLRECLNHPKFLEGDLSTAFIEEQFPDGYGGTRLDAAKLEQEERKREFEEAKRLRKMQDEERRLKKQKEIEERKREVIERRRLKQQVTMGDEG